MDRVQTLEMFVEVAQRGSFIAAARALRASPPAVTRGIAELEARLGVTLFHRSTRAVSLTNEGAGFLPRARRVLDDLADAERELSGALSEPSGQLNLTAPVEFGRLHLLPVVAELVERHAALDIRLLLLDRNIRLIEEGIDVAVRIGPLADSALKSVQIGRVRQVLVASPDYLVRFGLPGKPSDLAGHRLIASDGPRATSEWRFPGHKPLQVRPRLRVSTVDAAVSAVEAGVGITNLLSYQAAEALSAGRMVEVLKPDTPVMLPVSLLFEGSRANAPATRAFIDAMRERGRLNLW